MHGMPKQQTVHMCESVISYIAEFCMPCKAHQFQTWQQASLAASMSCRTHGSSLTKTQSPSKSSSGSAGEDAHCIKQHLELE